MPLPSPINHQDFLLTLKPGDDEIIKNALPGVHVAPLFLDPENGIWVVKALFEPGVTLPKHFHTGVVHLWTLSGQWNYLEYPDQPQTAGCYLYEPGGSIHQLHVPETNDGLTETVMLVQGCNVNFDENDEFMNIMDAGWIETMVLEAAKRNGQKAKYIKPGGLARYTE